MIPHRRRKRTSREAVKLPGSPLSAPLPTQLLSGQQHPHVLLANSGIDGHENQFSMKGNNSISNGKSANKRTVSHRRAFSNSSAAGHKDKPARAHREYGACWALWECMGMNFIIPTLCVWTIILTVVWWPELKDNALDYYYLYYPEQQPLSPIPGTVLPLLPSVWVYDPDKTQNKKLKQEVREHLKEHRQPHYYMLPQDFYDQQPPTDNLDNYTSADGSNTAFQAPDIRGILIVLHACHQTGLHFFQLPESRIVAAHALQRGLAIFSPTASDASTLIKSAGNVNRPPKQIPNALKGQEKHCWSASLDGDELLGPLLYEWVREMDLVNLPRMAIGISNGANLIMDSNLYTTLRLQSMVLYGSHHAGGFDAADLERDIIPATTFVVFPRNQKATQFAMQEYKRLQENEESDEKEDEDEKQPKVESTGEEENEDKEDGKAQAKVFFPTMQIYSAEPHPWTTSLCQARLPEYHTRCRSFFRHVAKYQQMKRRKAEERNMRLDPQQRTKRLRLAATNTGKMKYQLISSQGEVLQSSASPQWQNVLESLELDHWTTHIMAFNLATSGRTKVGNQKKVRQKKTQLMQFPTTATPEGRSWLFASMLQEIEVAYGLQEMTSEHCQEILDFLLFHAGLSVGSVAKSSA